MSDSVANRLPTLKGYMVHPRGINFARANAFLTSPDRKTYPLFVEEYTTTFQLSGGTAQSQMVRAFYPRNFEQPVFLFTCQAPDQAYRNGVGEFIRYSQKMSVKLGTPGTLEMPSSGLHIKSPNMKGRSQGFLAEGYVVNGTRGGQKGEFAPTFQFGFTVSRMRTGLYRDQPVKIRQLKSWADIMKSLESSGSGTTFVVNPDLPLDVVRDITPIINQIGQIGGPSVPNIPGITDLVNQQ